MDTHAWCTKYFVGNSLYFGVAQASGLLMGKQAGSLRYLAPSHPANYLLPKDSSRTGFGLFDWLFVRFYRHGKLSGERGVCVQ